MTQGLRACFRPSVAGRWRNPLAALLLCALAVFACQRAWGDIFRIALGDEESSHILLAPLIVLWLALARRRELARITPAPSFVGAVFVMAGAGASWAGYHFAIQSFWHGGAVLALLGAVVGALGTQVLRLLAPAALVLFFMVPVPGMLRQSVALPLQQVTARLVAQTLAALGVDISRQGSLLTIAGNDVNIAEACNGLRMVLALLLVCYGYLFARRLSPLLRGTLLALSPLVAMACNFLRMLPTVYLYGHASPAVADAFHLLAGYLMLLPALLLIMGLCRLLQWLGRGRGPAVAEAAGEFPDPPIPPQRGLWQPLAALLLPAVLLLGLAADEASHPTPTDLAPYHARVRLAAEGIAYHAGSWVGSDLPVPPAAIALLNPNVMFYRRYLHLQDGAEVGVLLVQCGDARDLAGHYPPVCYPAQGYRLEQSQDMAWLLGAQAIAGKQYLFSRGSGPRQVRLYVDDLLVLPDGRFVREMSQLRQVAGDYRRRLRGAAQVQFLTSPSLTDQQRRRAVEQLLPVLAPVIQAVQQEGESQ